MPNEMEWNKKTVAAALVILFGANSTGIINAFIPGFRADSFSLSDFQEEKALMLQADEIEMDKLRHRITRLESQASECRRRIDKCENYDRSQ